ncbi:MAG: VOC family protein [Verrucomicrobia bacterium]|nr:VOC family protein [Verrucomicrobiota bacterium]
MKHYELNHVAIHVKDVEKSCEFYRTVLRLEPIPRPAFTFPGAWFRLGISQELHLIGNRSDPVYAGNRSNHYALRVDDLTPWERHFQELGVKYLPRRARPDGALQMYVADPDGHVIELFIPPPSDRR